MRLLYVKADGSLDLAVVANKEVPKYAILSHTWERDDQEVTFRDFERGIERSKIGYRKIQFCAERARLDDIQYFWVDSCCIDKSNNTELTEAINSMFRWYHNAAKCYVYLSDAHIDLNSQTLRQCRWFTRGWTLQELLAPGSVQFFTQDGRYIGDRQSLQREICDITGIPAQALQKPGDLFQFSTDERMSWLGNRETSIEEDRAYCLFGIFNVHMTLIYGEGEENAFRRLRTEIAAGHARDTPKPVDASTAEKTNTCLAKLAVTDQKRFISQVLHRSQNACVWIRENVQFIQWATNVKPTLLWITAKPGYGKTTTAAHVWQMSVLDRAPQDSTQSPNVTLSFFFQRSNDEALTTGIAALRTMVHQLARQVPASLATLLKRHNSLSARGDFQWSWDSLAAILVDMLNSVPPNSAVYIIVDALDECEARSRGLMLEWLKELVRIDRDSAGELRVLVTSRPDGDITEELVEFPTLEVTESETSDDMRTLIDHRVRDFAVRRRLKQDVTDAIVRFLQDNARGMFLWVNLIMKELEKRDARLSDEVIAFKLSSIPLTLTDTYSEILDSVPFTRRQDMWRIFRWLLFGSRSPTLSELEVALCLETDTSTWYDFVGDLKFLCGSLIQFSDAHQEVTFVHQTARAFLEMRSQEPAIAATIGLDLSAHMVHEQLAIVCIRGMMQDEMSSRLPRKLARIRTISAYVEFSQEFLEQNPFLRYATESWHFHVRAAEKPSDQMSAMVRTLLLSQERRDNIMRLTYFVNKGSWNAPIGQYPIHLAAYFNIPWLAEMYISLDKRSVHSTTDMNDTPLIWASEMGSTEVAKILLDAGADPNELEIDGWSALHWAARNGHPNLTVLLLERGANVLHQDRSGNIPYDWAMDRENLEVASILDQWSKKHSSEALPTSIVGSQRWNVHHDANSSRYFGQKKWQLRDQRP